MVALVYTYFSEMKSHFVKRVFMKSLELFVWHASNLSWEQF